MSDFKREPRYVVFKITDLHQYCSSFNIESIERVGNIIAEGRAIDGKSPFNAVVVEQDWPEFDMVWAAIEARMTAANGESAKATFDLVAHLHRQREFSERTFGPGTRTSGVCDHIRKELNEIEAKPDDVSEWVDVILLALDGAWRAGFSPEQIAQAVAAKQERNESRKWPDWRTADPDKAIEHVREELS